MSEERRDRRGRLMEDIETVVDEVNKAVRDAVSRSSGISESVGENLRDSIKETVQTVVSSTRDSVVNVRVNKESLNKLDVLVESGLANSRSEAAAFLIAEGIKAQQGLFDKIAEKIEQIRKTKEELRDMLEEDQSAGQSQPG